MSLTIGETIQQLHRALRDYIEATYHVSHPTLVAQRRQTLGRARRDPPAPISREHTTLQNWPRVR